MKPCTRIEDELWGHIKIKADLPPPHRKARSSTRRHGDKVDRAAVFRSIERGLTTEQIATRHNISTRTVQTIRKEYAARGGSGRG